MMGTLAKQLIGRAFKAVGKELRADVQITIVGGAAGVDE
jgi:hypothetical protein